MHDRREKSWHGQILGAIVRAIATRHSFKPAIGAAIAKILIDHIDHTHESDMSSFLTRLAKRYDAEFDRAACRIDGHWPAGNGRL
ncbi:hypothetical protein bAD24_p01565 (plasmid) [Burkholderia sp. AD24]|nr:hypothetical protein bAD24_p01565 [Burkholderia sp. AD24]